MVTRQRAIWVLRSLGILGAAERVRFVLETLKGFRSNRDFRRRNPTALMPPRWLAYDAFGDVDNERYMQTGQEAAAYLTALVGEFLPIPAVVCEWGCGPGRILRHLVGSPSFSRVIGSDFNEASIAWCERSLPEATWVINGLRPPIALPDNYVDFVYGISVLTHMSETLGLEWISELRRIVRPGGLIAVTLQGQWYRDAKLLPNEQQEYDRKGFVGRGRVLEGSRSFVAFHNPNYVRSILSSGLEEVRHTAKSPSFIAGHQELWVFRKP